MTNYMQLFFQPDACSLSVLAVWMSMKLTVWSGLHGVRWCTPSALGGPLHWCILSLHPFPFDHPGVDWCTVLCCHWCTKAPDLSPPNCGLRHHPSYLIPEVSFSLTVRQNSWIGRHRHLIGSKPNQKYCSSPTNYICTCPDAEKSIKHPPSVTWACSVYPHFVYEASLVFSAS